MHELHPLSETLDFEGRFWLCRFRPFSYGGEFGFKVDRGFVAERESAVARL